jgi:hypothetical protein
MSAEPYIPEKYISVPNAMDSLGITEALQKTITPEEKKRYQDWTRNANNRVETELFPDSDAIPLVEGSNEFTYARSACVHWVLYERRNYTGSANAKDALEAYNKDIELAKQYLKRLPSDKNIPIQVADTTDSVGDNYKIPYSQTQGYPPSILY